MENNQTAASVPAARRLPAWVVLLAFLLLVAFLALIAWGLQRSNQPPIQIGDQVPAFSLTTFDGKVYKTNELAGKVIVVNFWASWCKPCEQEAEDLETAWKYYQPKGNVIFLGVNWVDTPREAQGYLDKFKITYPNGPDERTLISQMFRIKGVPETYIIGKDGRLKEVKISPFLSVNEIRSMIDPYLK